MNRLTQNHWTLIVMVVPLFVCSEVHAQLLVQAGAGTLFGSTDGGLSVTSYRASSQMTAGVEYVDGRILPGASETFKLHDGSTVIAGTQSIGLSDQTTGIGLSMIGVGLRKTSKHSSLQFFTGAIGAGYYLGFANASIPSHVGAGILFQHEFSLASSLPIYGHVHLGLLVKFISALRTGSLNVSSLDVVAGGQRTAAESVGYQYHNNAKTVVDTGLLNNTRFLNAALITRYREVSLYGSHQDYYLSPTTVRADNLGINFTHSFLTLNSGVNQSAGIVRVLGENAGVGVTFWRLIENSTWYHTPHQELLAHTINERISPRITLTENISQSAGHNSFSGGGSLALNRLQLSLIRSVTFLLTGQYQNVTALSVSIRIHDSVVSAQSVVDPLGRTRWIASGDNYLQGNLPGFATHGNGSSGRYVIAGRCLQDQTALEGCSIVIDGQTVISNSHGEFELRRKKNKAVPVAVDLNSFTAPGNFEVLSAPAMAVPGESIQVIVRRTE